jgi:hypothetical protein
VNGYVVCEGLFHKHFNNFVENSSRINNRGPNRSHGIASPHRGSRKRRRFEHTKILDIAARRGSL